MVSKILIEGRIQCVEYESLSLVCFGYGRFGHVRESCSYNFEQDETMEKLESVNLGKTSKSEEKSNEDLFGPWMLVERRKPQTFKSTTIKSSGINGGTMVRRREGFGHQSMVGAVEAGENFGPKPVMLSDEDNGLVPVDRAIGDLVADLSREFGEDATIDGDTTEP
ncbi:hypothetical protein PVK06_012062 [Gossypium arboreum]|uniref:Uncharacterized protein n=1 Tax=Gossypium arboreum TaxID=29729 RepID=A0ABR0QAV4_GOSAR|nr:hypothetical protein PVK06_012062 [Gossypium arboreum]